MLKLLIADDEADTSNAIRRTIPWKEHDILLCSEASNGKEAIEIIEDEHPDIALLDVRMPLLDGLGVVKYIHDKQLNIRMIILSGYDEFSYAQTALKYGVSDYLLKPCRMEDILNSINMCKKLYLQDLEHQNLLRGFAQSFFEDIGEPVPDLPAFTDAQYLQFETQKKRLLEFIGSGDSQKSQELLQDIFQSIEAYTRTKNIIINHFLSLMLDVMKLCKDCSLTIPSELHTLIDYKQMACFTTLKDLEKTADTAISQITESIRVKSEKSVSIRAAVDYIHQHYSETIDLNVLARHIHITPAYLSLIFKVQTGINFLDYLTQYRIEQACRLLKETDLKNYEIAYETGFRDEKYFSTVFKKATGVTPSKYRKIYS